MLTFKLISKIKGKIRPKKTKEQDLACDFKKYDGTDKVCQITGVFIPGETLVKCETCGLVKYENSPIEGVKCNEKPWRERRKNKAYEFVQIHQRDIPAVKELIIEDLKIRFQCLEDKDITFGKFSDNSDEWFESLKHVCSKEMNVGKGEYKDNTLLGLFYRNAIFTDRYGGEEVLPETTGSPEMATPADMSTSVSTSVLRRCDLQLRTHTSGPTRCNFKAFSPTKSNAKLFKSPDISPTTK